MARRAKLIPKKMLSSDERIMFETRPSAWLFMKAASLALFVALISLIVFLWKWIPDAPSIPYLSDYLDGSNGTVIQMAFGALFFVLFIFFLYRYLKWGSTVYAATDERIITQRGILNKTYEDIPVTMITNIDLAQSLGKRALGYGSIVFSTQGMSGARKADIVWEAVPNPFSVRRKIQEVMDVRVKPKDGR
jgi:membrane protein YdbS with pleckstrin-like domain